MKKLAVVIATALAVSLHAQTDWRLLDRTDAPRSNHAMAFDLVTSKTILFGGLDGPQPMAATRLWDGQQWTDPSPAIEPPARAAHCMACDITRGRVVLFGGLGTGGVRLADTWEWNGANWSQQVPAHQPPPRAAAAMAHDLLHGRTLLFGGELANGVLDGELWEWDGVDWTQRLAPFAPPARSLHAMAYDLLRGRTVLFGGSLDDGSTTWEWDGVIWTNSTTNPHPASPFRSAMAYDLAAGRTLLLQSVVSNTSPSAANLWSWDGSQWTNLTAATPIRPTARMDTAMVYELARARTVVFGGEDRTRRGDTWEWDGAGWRTATPPARTSAALAFNPASGTALLFGGNGVDAQLHDSWSWRDGAWHFLQPANSPGARADCGVAQDTVRNVAVLFGGRAGTAAFAETWEWNGANWNQRNTTGQPPARISPAMTFDAERGEVLLFGGYSVTPVVSFQDTWTWNGTVWTQKAPTTQPSPRVAAAFAFDAARRRCVLFSGMPFLSTVTNDTWEWDGTNWIARAPAHAPSARYAAAFVSDTPRQRLVLVGGYGVADQIWEWDGIDWTQRSVTGPGTVGAGSVFDTVANRTLVFGPLQSSVNPVPVNETWSYGPVNPATLAPFGAGCVGSAGAPALFAVDGSLPWLGDALSLAVEPVPANAPVLLALGFSRTSFGGAALPASLDAIGMTGCTLLVSLDELLLAFSNGARADFTLTVPTTTSLVGLQFFAQAAVADAAANPAGIVASNALEGRIGSR